MNVAGFEFGFEDVVVDEEKMGRERRCRGVGWDSVCARTCRW